MYKILFIVCVFCCKKLQQTFNIVIVISASCAPLPFIIIVIIIHSDSLSLSLNSNNESKGWVSWQDLAYPTTDPKWSVQESITISLGTNHNAQTYTGSSLSVATGGYYDLGTTYTFYVSDDNGNNAVVSINKIDNVVRNVIFERVKR